jgi:hypothetical protein
MNWLAKVAALARGWHLSPPSKGPAPVSSALETVASAAPLGTPVRRAPMRISDEALAAAGPTSAGTKWETADPHPGVIPSKVKLAMDSDMSSTFDWMTNSRFSEGMTFFGYPYLAELTQRAEYRRPSEIIAKAMTMKWIKFTATGEQNKDDKIDVIEAEFKRLKVQDRLCTMSEHDGFFGRGQLFLDMIGVDSERDRNELAMPLLDVRSKIGRGIQQLVPVEAMWTYPNRYNSQNPLKPDFFKATSWYVMGTEVHASRMLTLVSRPVPDMLKPVYGFGGLSLTQIMKPYVDNWLRTRQSVSDLIHNFSVMALKTDLTDILNAGAGTQMFNRADLFNRARDNRSLFMLNKDTEELDNISVPLGTLDALQAQSQEHQAAVTGIPLIIMFGITPKGLNATAEPELKTFGRNVLSWQQSLYTPPITRILNIVQLAKFGEIDPEIGFKYEPLTDDDMKILAETRKVEADTDEVMINSGVISPAEARNRVAQQEDSPYSGLDVSMVPEPPGEEGMGLPGLGPEGEPGPEQPPNPNAGAVPPPNGARPPGARPNGAVPAHDEKWITVHGGKEGGGQPVLITEGGVVKGGAGGSMNGMVLRKAGKEGAGEAPKPEHSAKLEGLLKSLQNRNRSSAASINQMSKIAANPNPRLLMAAPTMADGAPVVADLHGRGIAVATGHRDIIVTPKRELGVRYAVVEADQISTSNSADGVKNADYAKDPDKMVAINNGRTAGVIEAYKKGTADAYKAAIAAGAKVHGIPGKTIRAMKSPVLVRVMDADDVSEGIADESNTTQTLTLSAVEQARNDADRFDASQIDYDDDGQPSEASVRGFIQTMPASEQQSLAPNGRPTRQAIDRMHAATFHAAYGDSELVGLMAQATDPESRTLIAGMSRAAGSMAKLKDAGELDIRELVTGAAKQIINAVRSGVSVKKFLKQGDLLTNSAEGAIASMMAENIRSGKAIGERLGSAADFAFQESQRGGIDIFGEQIPTASREDVLKGIGHAEP